MTCGACDIDSYGFGYCDLNQLYPLLVHVLVYLLMLLIEVVSSRLVTYGVWNFYCELSGCLSYICQLVK